MAGRTQDAVPAAGRALRRPRRRTSGPTCRTARRCCAGSGSCPGFGAQKSKIFLALLGKQYGVTPPGWREAAGDYGLEGSRRSVADITGPESLVEVRAFKQEQKQAAKKAADASSDGRERRRPIRWHDGSSTGDGRGDPRADRAARGWMPVASSQQFPRSRRPEPVLITEAEPSLAEQHAARKKRYAITMGIRARLPRSSPRSSTRSSG